MPLTLTATEGVFARGTEKVVFKKLCEAMLKWHGLSGNRVMTPNVVGAINVIPKEHTYAGLQDTTVVFVEWKVPSFAFATREIQQGYVEEATRIVVEHSEGKRQPRERIWVNVLHAVDGAWGIAGEAMTNEQLGEAVAKG
jgi:hypothetical protein